MDGQPFSQRPDLQCEPCRWRQARLRFEQANTEEPRGDVEQDTGILMQLPQFRLRRSEGRPNFEIAHTGINGPSGAIVP